MTIRTYHQDTIVRMFPHVPANFCQVGDHFANHEVCETVNTGGSDEQICMRCKDAELLFEFYGH